MKFLAKIMLESVYYTKGFEVQILCAQMRCILMPGHILGWILC